MPFKLLVTRIASEELTRIGAADPRKHRKVLKCLGLLEVNPKHPSLNSHRYDAYDDIHGEKIWESYVENKTPGAYRVFWHYGPGDREITIIAITPHS